MTLVAKDEAGQEGRSAPVEVDLPARNFANPLARAVVEQVCADLGESYEEISILDDPALQERYGEEIPVTLVDGRQHDFWRVDPDRLRAALTG
jgi:hypothetical protein